MNRTNGLNNLIQMGIILGRITQLSVDRGVVVSGSGMGLSDFLILLAEEVKKVSVPEPVINKILDEIKPLSENLADYPRDTRLEPDDARVMISLVSRWTDLLYDELMNESEFKEGTTLSEDVENETVADISDEKPDVSLNATAISKTEEKESPQKNKRREKTSSPRLAKRVKE